VIRGAIVRVLSSKHNCIRAKGVLLGSALLFCLLLSLSCATLTGGSAGETGNPIVMGRIADQNGNWIPGAKTMAINASFDPKKDVPIEASMMATTDDFGLYAIKVAKKSVYNIQAVNPVDGSRALICGLSATTDTLYAPTGVVRKPGYVKVLLQDSAAEGGYVYLPGTTCFADVKNGVALIDSVPDGIIPAVLLVAKGETAPALVSEKVAVSAGDTAVVAQLAGWSHSQALRLNTTASGAGVMANVMNFPVLVRLTGSNFNFSEAKTDGRDVRFSKANGSPLSYEIERWDAVNGQAELWVKVDTVYGNNSAQVIVMYWGNSNAASESNGAAVFDTSSGFQGVWHLAEQSGSVLDATANRIAGTYSGTLPDRVAGAIGEGQLFGGSGDFIDMGNILNIGANNFSISAWVKRGKTSVIQVIAGKSNGRSPSTTYGFSFALFPVDTLNIAVASGGTTFGDSASFQLKSSIAITDTTSWHHVAAVVDRSNSATCRLFIDGVDRSGNAKGDITTVGPVVNTLPFRLGEDALGNLPFAGRMDEVEIAYTARSADWFKLEYMNRKAVDALVQIK
jgi:hypothetical protein